MKFHHFIMGSLYVAVALILSCSRTTNPLISNKKNLMKQEDINKSIVRDFYRRAVSQGDIAFAEEIVADDYIQHSSAVKPGKAGLLEALNYMKQMPKPATTSTPRLPARNRCRCAPQPSASCVARPRSCRCPALRRRAATTCSTDRRSALRSP